MAKNVKEEFNTMIRDISLEIMKEKPLKAFHTEVEKLKSNHEYSLKQIKNMKSNLEEMKTEVGRNLENYSQEINKGFEKNSQFLNIELKHLKENHNTSQTKLEKLERNLEKIENKIMQNSEYYNKKNNVLLGFNLAQLMVIGYVVYVISVG